MPNFKFQAKPNQEVRSYNNEELTSLVHNYRNNIPGASDALLVAFNPLISKYFNLLAYGIYNRADQDASSFLNMTIKVSISDSAKWLSTIIRRTHEPNDIYNECVLALFETASKYVAIYSNYKLVLKGHITDILGRSMGTVSLDNPVSIDGCSSNNLEYLDAIQMLNATSQIESGEIDESWIDGLTCSEAMSKLTPMQRALIKYIYEDELGVSVAAKLLGLTEAQARKQRRKARVLLAKELGIVLHQQKNSLEVLNNDNMGNIEKEE